MDRREVGPLASRRLGAVAQHVTGPNVGAEPAAGLVSWLSSLFGGEGGGESGSEDVASDGEGSAVRGTVLQCYVAADAAELADSYEGGILPDGEHFRRHPVPSISVDATDIGPSSNYPPSHQGFAATLADPNERALLCTTAEGYQKLADGLPAYAEHFGSSRPGSGEQLHVSGLEQWECCIGDVFAVPGKATRLQVSSPRRPCDKWNMTHNPADPTHRLGHPDDVSDGNVRHWCLTHTLGGIFFRVLDAGDIAVGDTVELVERPHPDWTLKRVGDLLYGQAAVHPDTFMKGEAWSGSADELDDLLAMEELATAEWKEVLQMAKTGGAGGAP
jgi:MOSC domain-containing protein YiiM